MSGAKQAVAETYMATSTWPTCNDCAAGAAAIPAGLPAANTITGNYVASVQVALNAANVSTVTATFRAAPAAPTEIAGLTVVLTPAAAAGGGSISWTCTAPGILPQYLPTACR
ncbi:MAG: pilin [Magnetococcus sp. MYC-9]